MGLGLEPPRIRRCANRCDFCFVDGHPAGPARRALHPRRRLPALLPLRQLRHADEPEAVGRRADHRVPAVAAVRLGARDRPGRAPLPAPQPDRARDHPAAAPVRRPRHRVPHPDRDVARGERRRGPASRRSRTSTPSVRTCWAVRWCRSGSRSTASTSWCASRPPAECRAAIEHDRGAGRRSPGGTRDVPGPSAPTSSTCAPGSSCRRPSVYDGFEQVENGVGAVRWLQQQIAREAECARRLAGQAGRRRDRHRHGAADAAGDRAAHRGTPAPVRADPGGEHAVRHHGDHRRPAARRARCATRCASRGDLDLVLLPGESVNDDGLFIDNLRSTSWSPRCRWRCGCPTTSPMRSGRRMAA